MLYRRWKIEVQFRCTVYGSTQWAQFEEKHVFFFFLFLFGHDSNMVMTHGSSKPDASVLLAPAPAMQGCVYGDIMRCAEKKQAGKVICLVQPSQKNMSSFNKNSVNWTSSCITLHIYTHMLPGVQLVSAVGGCEKVRGCSTDRQRDRQIL